MSDSKLEGASIVQKLLSDRAEAEKRHAIVAEDIEEYKKALNGVASTPNGQFVLKKLLRYSAIFHDDDKLDPARLVEDKGRRSVYLRLIRPFLTPEARMEIEQ